MTIKYLNGHIMDLYPIYGMGEGLEEIVVWCKTCDPEGAQYIFQRDARDIGDVRETIKDAVVQAKLHAAVDLTSN